MLYVFGFYMLIQTIPLFVKSLVSEENAEVMIGIVASSYTVAAIAMRLFSPLIIGKIGKKVTLRIGIAFTVIVTASCAFARDFPAAIVFRFTQGLGFGIVSTICATLAADLLPDDRRGEGIGFFGMGTTAMVAFSPAIGLWLVNNVSFDSMFFTAAAVQLLSLICISVFSKSVKVSNSEKPQDAPRKRLFENFFVPALALQCVLLILFGIGRSAEQGFLSVMAKERGILLYWYVIFQTFVSFIAKFITGKLFDKHGPAASVLPGGISLLIALAIMSFAPNLWILLIAGFFSGAGMGALLPAMQSWTVARVSPDKRAVASASYYNFYDIGITIGSSALGAVAAKAGYGKMYISAASIMCVFVVVFIAAYLKRRPRENIV